MSVVVHRYRPDHRCDRYGHANPAAAGRQLYRRKYGGRQSGRGRSARGNLNGAHLNGAKLPGAILQGDILINGRQQFYSIQIDGIKFDSTTEWPEGL